MGGAEDLGSLVRFGGFELDRDAGELRKHGLKIRLADQPFQILLLLLERPGRVVTREELKKKLWESDTFVDFDRGLNKAVNRLRDVLGDSADRPRFIETLPKRGYRFIASIENSPAVAGLVAPDPSTSAHSEGSPAIVPPRDHSIPQGDLGQYHRHPVDDRWRSRLGLYAGHKFTLRTQHRSCQ